MSVFILVVNVPDALPDPERKLAHALHTAAVHVETRPGLGDGELRDPRTQDLVAKWTRT